MRFIAKCQTYVYLTIALPGLCCATDCSPQKTHHFLPRRWLKSCKARVLILVFTPFPHPPGWWIVPGGRGPSGKVLADPDLIHSSPSAIHQEGATVAPARPHLAVPWPIADMPAQRRPNAVRRWSAAEPAWLRHSVTASRWLLFHKTMEFPGHLSPGR